MQNLDVPPEEESIDLEEKENREAFSKRLEGKFTEIELEDIDHAYDIAKGAHGHKQQFRDSGERYFEHPRQGCLIILDELGIYDADLIISFLLHDTGEDTPEWGNIKVSYDTFVKKARYRIRKNFSERVFDNFIRLTKPAVDGVRFKDKKEVYDFYLAELQKSSEAVLLKMVDRLHNLRSLKGNKPEKIAAQIKETEEMYLPMFSAVTGEWEEHAKIMVSKIKVELEQLKNIQ